MQSFIKQSDLDVLHEYDKRWVSADLFYEELKTMMSEYNVWLITQHEANKSTRKGFFGKFSKEPTSQPVVGLQSNPCQFARDVKKGFIVLPSSLSFTEELLTSELKRLENIRTINTAIRTSKSGSGGVLCELYELNNISWVIWNKEEYLA